MTEDNPCSFLELGAFEMVEKAVNYCPSCGSKAEGTITPTMFRCCQSGEVFYVER